MKIVELTNKQYDLIKAVLFQYVNEKYNDASDCEHDKELHDFFLERAKEVKSVYQAFTDQGENK